MKYQVIKHLKSSSRVLAIVGTLEEAKATLYEKLPKNTGIRFAGISYIGGFPQYEDTKGKMYSIQGYAEPWGIVCSLPQKEVESFTF